MNDSYDWLTAPRAALATLLARFGIGAGGRPGASEAIYLIDARGFERAGYLFPFQPYTVPRDVHAPLRGSVSAAARSSPGQRQRRRR